MPAAEDDDDAWRTWAQQYPAVRALNLTCTRMSVNSVTFVMERAPFPDNPNGAVNGGVLPRPPIR